MRKFWVIFSILMVHAFASAKAQFTMLYSDTTVMPGTTLELGVQFDVYNDLFIQDDIFSEVVPIGFAFPYFDSSYQHLVISSNNFVNFDTTKANTASNFNYANCLNFHHMDKAILFPFQDLYPFNHGRISVFNTGIAPNRKMIIEFCKLTYFGCNADTTTNQLALCEDGKIEMHIKNKATNCTWQNNTAIQGLRNNNAVIYIPGRDVPNVSWSAVNDGKLFTPSGNNNYTISNIPYHHTYIIPQQLNDSLKWYNNLGQLVGQGNHVTVTPTTGITYYTVQYEGILGCGLENQFLSDTVWVNVTDTTTIPNSVVPSTASSIALSVYPNPTKTNLTVYFGTAVTIQAYEITSVMGTKVAAKHNIHAASQYKINTIDIPSGNYFIKVVTDKGIFYKKIQIVE
jgi:hypothetical protein